MKTTIKQLRERIKGHPVERVIEFSYEFARSTINRTAQKESAQTVDIFDKVYYYEAKRDLCFMAFGLCPLFGLNEDAARFYRKAKATENYPY